MNLNLSAALEKGSTNNKQKEIKKHQKVLLKLKISILEKIELNLNFTKMYQNKKIWVGVMTLVFHKIQQVY